MQDGPGKEELEDGRWIGHPLYSDFYADLSDDALSDLENPEYDDTWKELCACPSEYSDCVCGAQDDYGWGDTEYLRPDREREEIQAEFNKTGDIDHRRLRKWRVTRKRCKDSSRNVIKRRQEEIKKEYYRLYDAAARNPLSKVKQFFVVIDFKNVMLYF